ncbi:hypothetical protein Pcinc_028154 [Petrolisthes cinctipes]|uniref:Uncharacterized protein n=1 Tax=Petrolisthes cinctipes TaxID=88211 RepID=A0AAE1K5R5_PETCI|nr:hypothetical protein Pcinc_028154 [Petrolisthes cinctipes]
MLHHSNFLNAYLNTIAFPPFHILPHIPSTPHHSSSTNAHLYTQATHPTPPHIPLHSTTPSLPPSPSTYPLDPPPDHKISPANWGVWGVTTLHCLPYAILAPTGTHLIPVFRQRPSYPNNILLQRQQPHVRPVEWRIIRPDVGVFKAGPVSFSDGGKAG